MAGQYCVSDQVTVWAADQHLVLSLTNDDESGDWDYEPQASLSSIIGIRDELEPPVPPGLRTLTAPQHELAEFLRVDRDLLAVARREHARALARQKRLDDLSHDEEAAWAKVEALIATRKPTEYDAAVALLGDLQALAERDDRFDTFTLRSMALRHAHARKPSLIERLNRANL